MLSAIRRDVICCDNSHQEWERLISVTHRLLSAPDYFQAFEGSSRGKETALGPTLRMKTVEMLGTRAFTVAWRREELQGEMLCRTKWVSGRQPIFALFSTSLVSNRLTCVQVLPAGKEITRLRRQTYSSQSLASAAATLASCFRCTLLRHTCIHIDTQDMLDMHPSPASVSRTCLHRVYLHRNPPALPPFDVVLTVPSAGVFFAMSTQEGQPLVRISTSTHDDWPAKQPLGGVG